MAKTDMPIVKLAPSAVGFDPDANTSRARVEQLGDSDFPTPSFVDLVESLGTHGYQIQASGPIAVTPVTPDRKEALMAVRKMFRAQLGDLKKAMVVKTVVHGERKNVTLEPNFLITVFEDTFCKDGEIIVPQYEVVYGFQRTLASFFALAVRRKLEMSLTDFALSATVHTFANIAERIHLCITENASKKSGTRPLDANDFTVAAAAMVKIGATQAEVQRALGTVNYAEVQRIFPLAQACNDPFYESLNLLERIRSRHINVASLNKEDLKKLISPVETKPDEMGKPRRVSLPPAPPEELEKYIGKRAVEYGKRTASEKRTPKDILALMTGSSNIFVKYMLAWTMLKKTDARSDKILTLLSDEKIVKAINDILRAHPLFESLGIPTQSWVES